MNSLLAKKILVVGDIILDHYIYGSVNRISPEAPVPIVKFTNEKWLLGGAANVANNLSSLKCNVTLAGFIGNDKTGSKIKELIKSAGITDSLYLSPDRKSTIKSRIISKNHQLLRIDSEDIEEISKSQESNFFEKIKYEIKEFDCIIISDYAKGVMTKSLTRKIIDTANSKGVKVLVDPKNPPFEKYKGAYLIKPNKKEAKNETGISIENIDQFAIAADRIKRVTSCDVVIITLSEDGVGISHKDFTKLIPTKAIEICDVTGAGDTFIATLAYAITHGKSILESCELANRAASIVIGKPGCVSIEYTEIKEFT